MQHLKRVTFGIAVAGVFFLRFPLELAFQRPVVEGWLGPFFTSLENFNNFYNCAPSLHIILRTNLWAIYVTPTRGFLRRFLELWFLFIGASTLLCWQHHIMDVITGQLVGLLCLWLFPSIPFEKPKADRAKRINAAPRVALCYGLACALLLVLTVLGWLNSVLLLWPAASLLILTPAYLGGGPTLLRKYQGRQLPSTRWLLNPYRWTAQLTAKYFNSKLPAYAELEPGLYLGRRLSNEEAEALEVEAVLDLTAEYDECKVFLQRKYLNVPILDLTLPSIEQVQECVDFIRQNPNCYVHCSLGRGRTRLVGAAYLFSKGASVEEAVERVCEARLGVPLAEGGEELLVQYKESCSG